MTQLSTIYNNLRLGKLIGTLGTTEKHDHIDNGSGQQVEAASIQLLLAVTSVNSLIRLLNFYKNRLDIIRILYMNNNNI